MNYREFRKEIQSGTRQTAYLLKEFSSAETDKAVQLLEDSTPEGTSMVVRESFVAPEGVSGALVSARSHPMWNEHKVLVVTNLESLLLKGSQRILKELHAYMARPSSWATFILVVEKGSGSIPSMIKSFSKKVAVVDPPSVQSKDIRNWIGQTLAKYQIELEFRAIQLLLDLYQEDWNAVERELEKIIAAFPPGSKVGIEQLQFLVEPQVEQSVFGILRSLSDGKTEQALKTIIQIKQASRNPKANDQWLNLWYWLYRQARN